MEWKDRMWSWIFRPITLGGIIIISFIFIVLKFFPVSISSPLLLSIGRFHPLVLHMSLALLPILFGAEVLRLYINIKINNNWMIIGLLATILSLFATIKSGYFLFASGEYTGMLMDQHFNGALITLVLAVIAFFLLIQFTKHGKNYSLYYLVLLTANLSIVFTGHQGASITHGPDYLSAYVPLIGQKPETNIHDSATYFYSDVIQPILDFKCGGCHNPSRAKGGLSLTTYADLLKKGESDVPGVTPSDTLHSEVYRRVLLPDSDKEHMPPAGKTNLTRDEIYLLKFWIQSGASNILPADYVTYAPVKDRISQMMPALKKYNLNLSKEKYTKIQIQNELMFLAKELEVEIKRDPKNDDYLYSLSNKFPPTPFDSRRLKELKPYLQQFSKVSLVSSQIDDADLYLIAQMDNVKELYLQKTKIKGFGLVQLSRLKTLEVLNISFTDTDDTILLDMLKFPALKELYVYGTKVTKDVILAVQKHRPNLKIYSEEGPYF